MLISWRSGEELKMDEELKQYLEAMERRVIERFKEFVRTAGHELETKIITEFHKWGRTSDVRTRQAITDTGLPLV